MSRHLRKDIKKNRERQQHTIVEWENADNFERDVIKNGLGYSEDEIIVTGKRKTISCPNCGEEQTL